MFVLIIMGAEAGLPQPPADEFAVITTEQRALNEVEKNTRQHYTQAAA